MKNYEDRLDIIERTDQLIRLNATGTSYQLAEILCISRASSIRLLQYLRTIGAPIKYCKYRKTYYYQYHVKLEISSILFTAD
jgi:hypothetical protein